jgi:transposase-like protein
MRNPKCRKIDQDVVGEVQRDFDSRLREGVRAVIEQILQEEMDEHLQARYRERTAARRGERNATIPVI